MKHLAMMLLMLLGISACKKDLVDTSTNQIPDITNLASFQQNIAEGVSLVFFHASWCTKCKEQRPAFEAASANTQRGTAQFFEVEYEDYKEIADAYDVTGFPTMVLFKDGKETKRFKGTGHSESELIEAIKALL